MEAQTVKNKSRSYPSFSLEECLQLTEKIHSSFGNRLSTRKEIADACDFSEGYMVKFVSSCKQFDLLEIEHGNGYRPSKTFINEILLAENEEAKQKTLIQCVTKPSLYSEILEKYKKIPGSLPVILVKDFGIQLNVKDKVAEVFIESLKFVNAISEDGIIKLNSTKTSKNESISDKVVHEDNGESENDNDTSSDDASKDPNKLKNSNHILKKRSGVKIADIKITNGRFVALEFPENINNQDIDKIIANLTTWKD